MPGIVGLITKLPRSRAERELARMVSTLRHEPFYVTGSWINETLGVYVGWIEHEGCSPGAMPLQNERGDVRLVFSGEEHSEHVSGVTAAITAKACDRRSYLVRAFESDSDDFPARLNGKFHGLLADDSRGTAILFNDRFGMHPLYYHESKDAFYFSAEIKGILAVRPELRDLDSRSLGEFIACGCVYGDRTVFSEIYELPRAARWVFRYGAPESKHSYFHPRQWEDQPSMDGDSYYRTLRAIFAQQLPRYFTGTDRVAVALTGGLDTRMIMAWQRCKPGSLPCYTFGGMFRPSRDVAVSQKVATFCAQPHRVITVGDDYLANFSRYAERTVYLTDGRAGVGRSPDLFLAEKAREVAPVRIAGVYGSEVLRRSRAYKPWIPPEGLFCAELASQIWAARTAYASLIMENPVWFAAFAPAPQRGINLLEQTQTSVRLPFLDNDLVRTAFHAPSPDGTAYRHASDNDICLRLIADGNATLRRLRTDRGLGGNGAFLTNAITRGFLEFTFKAEYAYDYGMPQWLARVDHAFSYLHFERLFLGRHKHYHFRTWYRGSLATYIKDMLLDPLTLSRPYVDPKFLEAMVEGHLTGVRNYTTEIHQILTLELLHRLFIDRVVPADS